MKDELMEEKTDSEEPDYTLAKIKGKIDDVEVGMLLDCGAESSCIDLHYLEQLEMQNKKKYLKLNVHGISMVTAVGHKHTSIKKQVMLEITIGKQIITVVFLVVNELNENIILGCDFLMKNSVSLCFGGGYAIIKEERINFLKESIMNIKTFNLNKGEVINDENVVWEKQINNIYNKLGNTEVKENVEQLIKIFEQNREIFSDRPGKIKGYTCTLHVKEDVKIDRKTYPIPQSKRQAVQQEINRLLDEDIIEYSDSPYTSPLHAILKPSGETRLCLDARQINRILIKDYTQPECIDNILARFHGVQYMSSFDLTNGFLQVELEPESRRYVAFLFNGRNFQFKRLPFGLLNSVGEFIKGLNFALGKEVLEFAYIYVDDLLICSRDLNEHCYRLGKLFSKLKEHNITLKLKKCEFLTDEVKFLGFIINREGISADSAKIEAIQNFQPPKNLRELQSFLGTCNYYRKFQKNYAHLTSKFENQLKRKNKFIWGKDENQTFNEIKKKFLECVVLRHPDFSKPFYLGCDASAHCIGAELFQLDDQEDHQVICFISRKLNKHERNYTITEKELLAIVFSCRKLRNYLLGNKVIVRTDHKALIFLKSCKLSHGRIMRWALLLQEYDLHYEFISGRENLVPDFLSRIGDSTEINNNNNEYKIFIMIRGDEVKKLVNKIKQNLGSDKKYIEIKEKLEKEDANINQYYVIKDELLFKRCHEKSNIWKIYIPDQLLKEVITYYHENLGHVGIQRTYKYLDEFIYNKGLKSKIKKIVTCCEKCQLVKSTNFNNNGLSYPIICKYNLHKVFCDVMGPLPISIRGLQYIFIMVDGFSKFVKLFPIRKAIASTLLCQVKKYIKEVGKPENLISDNAKQFVGKVWNEGLESLGIRPKAITVYHPQSNLSERYFKEVGIILRMYLLNKPHVQWHKYVETAEDVINKNYHTVTQYKPIEVMFGKKHVDTIYKVVRFPENFENLNMSEGNKINEEVFKRISKYAELSLIKSKRKKGRIKYSVGDIVLVRNVNLSNKNKKISRKLLPKYKGRYIILECRGRNYYVIKNLKDDKISTINQSLLKPFHIYQ